jgi:hypothetical protein
LREQRTCTNTDQINQSWEQRSCTNTGHITVSAYFKPKLTAKQPRVRMLAQ